jgi:allantoate deiminase
MDVEIDSGLVGAYLGKFASHGAYGETGVWRTLYSHEWVAAADTYAAWCSEAGLDVRRDAVGNVWGRLEGRDGSSSIVSGSHIDTVTPGGKFDGSLGAIGALIAIRALSQRYGPPRRTLEAVALCEEESSRFRANFWGSRAIIGGIAPPDPNSIIGFDGVTLADAMRSVGLDPARCAKARRDDIGAFIELHIEQGPVLEAAQVPVAIVTGITAIRGVLVEIKGTANHAGAFPMAGRRDPVAGFAEIVAGVTSCAEDMGPPAVTTIGRIEVEPNLSTAIAGTVRFTIDARHADTEKCAALCAAQDALMQEIAKRRGLAIDWQITSRHDACQSAPALLEALRLTARDMAIPTLEMVSGAAHDAQQIARIAPVAMIFVRSKDGRSHTPEEFSSTEDIVKGIRLLTGTLHRLAY